MKSKLDLKTSACTTPVGAMSKAVKKALSSIHDTVISKYYGCGLCIPPLLEGSTVLDLGCGAGRDVYAIAQLVGENGNVIGVDMTDEQLETAREFEDWHREKFGFSKSNVQFKKGLIEKLDEVGIESDSIDVIVSNCVINLVPDKEAVIREVARTLKVGGELYFSDVYSDKVVSEAARKNEMLWGECISGALLWSELAELCEEYGLSEPLLVEASPIEIKPELESLLGTCKFVSATYRIFKPPAKSTGEKCTVTYGGQISELAEKFTISSDLVLETGKARAVPVAVSDDLKTSRYASNFRFETANCVPGSRQPLNPFSTKVQTKGGGCGPSGCC